MILSSHLRKEERKDSSVLPLALMLELGSVTGDRAGLGLFGRADDSESELTVRGWR